MYSRSVTLCGLHCAFVRMNKAKIELHVIFKGCLIYFDIASVDDEWMITSLNVIQQQLYFFKVK